MIWRDYKFKYGPYLATEGTQFEKNIWRRDRKHISSRIFQNLVKMSHIFQSLGKIWRWEGFIRWKGWIKGTKQCWIPLKSNPKPKAILWAYCWCHWELFKIGNSWWWQFIEARMLCFWYLYLLKGFIIRQASNFATFEAQTGQGL